MTTPVEPSQKPSTDLGALRIERSPTSARSRGSRSRGWITPLVVVLLLGGAAYVFRGRIAELVDSATLPLVKTQRVALSNPAAVAAVAGTSSNGYVVARTRAALSADTPGRIVEMNVEEGSVVKKGDVVARLFDEEYAAALRRAQAELASAEAGVERARFETLASQSALETVRAEIVAAEADIAQYDASEWMAKIALERAGKLLEDKVGSIDTRDRAQRDLAEATARAAASRARLAVAKQNVAHAEAQVEVARAGEREAGSKLAVAKAAVELAQATLDKTAVRAPFDGIVVLKDAEVGEVVSPNSQGGSNARGSVATMVDWSSLEVQVELQETSLAVAKIGELANIYLDAYPDRLYKGRVRRIWPTANRQKATVEVRVAFETLDDRLRPEMGARVVFSPSQPSNGGAERQEPALLVPRGAIVRIDGKSGVFVLERDVVRFRAVVLGDERSGRVIVKSGLADGEQIVNEPKTTLADGDRVRIQE